MRTRRFDLEEFETITHPDVDEMLWFAGRWWWFPTASVSLDSAQFEWRDNRVYLLHPDGSAVEGIMLAGEVATE